MGRCSSCGPPQRHPTAATGSTSTPGELLSDAPARRRHRRGRRRDLRRRHRWASHKGQQKGAPAPLAKLDLAPTALAVLPKGRIVCAWRDRIVDRSSGKRRTFRPDLARVTSTRARLARRRHSGARWPSDVSRCGSHLRGEEAPRGRGHGAPLRSRRAPRLLDRLRQQAPLDPCPGRARARGSGLRRGP